MKIKKQWPTFIFKKRANLASFSFIISLLISQLKKFYSKLLWKMSIQSVSGEGIWTHNLLIVSLHPYPLDQSLFRSKAIWSFVQSFQNDMIRRN